MNHAPPRPGPPALPPLRATPSLNCTRGPAGEEDAEGYTSHLIRVCGTGTYLYIRGPRTAAQGCEG